MPVGTTLMNLRRERGKTLAELENGTKIMGRMLSALENERWDELPAPVYVKGYIQNYASVLGVDPMPLLDEYAKDISARPERTVLRKIPESTVVPNRMDVHDIPRQAWVALAAAVLVVALIVWGISALMTRDDAPPPIPPETTTTPTPTIAPDGQTGTIPESEG
ncbi:MAG: helix-turn-helix domain-containing protein [Coriobacteriia bacterium]